MYTFVNKLTFVVFPVPNWPLAFNPVAHKEPSVFITNEVFVWEPLNNWFTFVTLDTDKKLVAWNTSLSDIMPGVGLLPHPYNLLSLVIA